jgi:hypothetical protein
MRRTRHAEDHVKDAFAQTNNVNVVLLCFDNTSRLFLIPPVGIAKLETTAKMAQRREAEKRLQNMTKGFIEKIRPALFAPVSMQQYVTTKDTPAKGPVWVSRTKLSRPEDSEDLKSVVRAALDELSTEGNRIDDFSIEDVNVQWTAFKSSGGEKESEPDISDKEKYNCMMKDVTSDIVVLYAHGGFY